MARTAGLAQNAIERKKDEDGLIAIDAQPVGGIVKVDDAGPVLLIPVRQFTCQQRLRPRDPFLP